MKPTTLALGLLALGAAIVTFVPARPPGSVVPPGAHAGEIVAIRTKIAETYELWVVPDGADPRNAKRIGYFTLDAPTGVGFYYVDNLNPLSEYLKTQAGAAGLPIAVAPESIATTMVNMVRNAGYVVAV